METCGRAPKLPARMPSAPKSTRAAVLIADSMTTSPQSGLSTPNQAVVRKRLPRLPHGRPAQDRPSP